MLFRLFRRAQSQNYPTPVRKIRRFHFRLPQFHFSWKKFLLFLGVLATLLFLIYIFFFSRIFKIQSIAVFGAKSISAEKLSAEVKNKFQGKFIYFLSESKVAAFVQEKYPRIVSVEIEKHWPDTLVIKVQEESIVLLWKVLDRIYGVNERGKIFSAGPPPPLPTVSKNPTETPTFLPSPTLTAASSTAVATPTKTVTPTFSPTPVPFPPLSEEEIVAASKKVPLVIDESNLPVFLGKQVASQDFIQFLNDVRTTLARRLTISVKEFRIKETTFEVFAVTNRFGIYFDTLRSAVEQVEMLARVLDAGYAIWQYADLRIPNKVYYK